MPNNQCSFRLITLAVMMAFVSSGALADNVTLTNDNQQNLTGTDQQDSIHIAPSDSSTSGILNNFGKITNYQTLTVANWKILNNTGTINVGHYGNSTDTAANMVNTNTGILYVNDNEFDLRLVNSGSIVSKTGTLIFNDRRVKIEAGSKITKEDGSNLSLIRIDYSTGTGGAGSFGGSNTSVAENAALQADSIFINVNNQGMDIDGSVIATNGVTVQGGYISLSENALISGTTVTLNANIDQITKADCPIGGEIVASEKLTMTGSQSFKDTVIEAPYISTPVNQLTLHGNAVIRNLERLELGSTFILNDSSRIEGNYVPEVILLGMESVNNAPRIQLVGNQPIAVGNLTVEKSTNKSGEIISAKLIDKMVNVEDGSVSLAVDNLNVSEGAKLAIYADDKSESAPETTVHIGTLVAGKDSLIELGWRSDGTEDKFAEKKIDKLILSEGSKLDGVSDRDEQIVETAVIGEIEFAGNNAEVTNTLMGTSTNITVKSGVSGVSLSSVQTDTFTVTIEDTSVANALYVADVGTTTSVTLIGGKENNTGDAVVDLTAVKDAVNLNGYMQDVTLIQNADDIYDGSSATLTPDGLMNVRTLTNEHVHGIAEMAALGLHVWRNEINDMNKRLGELRDSSAQSNGVWARVYTGQARMGTVGVKNEYTALQMGYDRQVASGVWLGGAVSYTDGDNDFRVGGGDSSLIAFTGYGSWLLDNGMFLDVTGKIGRMKNSFDIAAASGTSSADYHTNAVSLSAEAGWRFTMADMFYVEPQVEMMWGHVSGVNYSTSVGVNVEQDSVETVIGRAGFVLGMKCPNNRGNAYVRASVLHDWQGDATFRFSKNGSPRTLSEDLGGTWYEYGIGANFNVTDQTHVYADLEAASGGEVDTDYRFNIGVRYTW